MKCTTRALAKNKIIKKCQCVNASLAGSAGSVTEQGFLSQYCSGWNEIVFHILRALLMNIVRIFLKEIMYY